MSQNYKKQWWQPDFGRNGSSHVDRVDAFVLNPRASRALVKSLFADPAWDTTCEEPDLVIFVRSTSECTERKDGRLWP